MSVPQESVYFPKEQYREIVQTMKEGQTFSNRVQELVAEGLRNE